MSVFSSEFWRNLYFAGMGGQASTETEPGQMAAILLGSASVIATISGGERQAEVHIPRKGGKDDGPRRRFVPQYVEWTDKVLKEIADRETALFETLLGKEPDPLPIAEKKSLDHEAELNRVNDLLLKAMAASADDAKRKQEQALKSAAKKAKVTPPDNAAETRAMVVWLAKRAEWLRDQEAADEEDIEILLLAA